MLVSDACLLPPSSPLLPRAALDRLVDEPSVLLSRADAPSVTDGPEFGGGGGVPAEEAKRASAADDDAVRAFWSRSG
eukprot:156346-Chlamydomonas_euryale.AAC.13